MSSAAVHAKIRDIGLHTLPADRSNREHKRRPLPCLSPFLLISTTTTTPRPTIDKATRTPRHYQPDNLFMSLSSTDTTIEDQPALQPTLPQPSYRRLDYATLLGHPHDIAEPQATEPFWHQYPDSCNFYYEASDFYTTAPLYYIDQSNMSAGQRVIIGYGGKKSTRHMRPREMVKVWQGTDEVGEIALGVLTRFSKDAKQEFPRGQATTNDNKSSAAEATTATIIESKAKESSKDWADEDSDEPFVISTEDAAKDDTEVSGHRALIPDTASTKTTPDLSKPKDFVVGTFAFTQPKLTHLKYILQWMEANKNSRHGEPLLPITPVSPDTIGAQALLDVYVAVLAFNMTPFPHALRHEILMRLTNEPTQLKQLQYMYDRLPEGDPIINRLVTSILEHEEARHYAPMEYHEIWNWVESPVEDGGVDDGGKLADHFARVERSRKRKVKEAQRNERREQAVGKLRTGFEALAGTLGDALPVVADKDARRRPRRQQQASGKAAASNAGGRAAASGKSIPAKATAGASK